MCVVESDPFSRRKTVNVVLLGVVFMLLASRTPVSIVKTVLYSATDPSGPGHIPGFSGDGYVANAVLYSTFALSNFLAPWVIGRLGPKYSMLLGGLGYTAYSAQLLHLSDWLLYTSAVLNGLGAAMLWTGQGNFLSINSDPGTVGRNAGIFWVLYQMSGVLGNTAVLFLFREVEVIGPRTRLAVGWALTAMCLSGQLVVLLLRPTPWAKARPGGNISPWQSLSSSLQLLATRDMLALSTSFLYSGLETSFWAGAFPSSIGFTLDLGSGRKMLLGLCSVMVPLGSILGGSVLILAKGLVLRVGRGPVVALGLGLHTGAYCLCLVFLPHLAPLGETGQGAILQPRTGVLVLTALLLGCGDACLNTQLISLLGGAYKERSAQAFSLMKLVQSVGVAGGFTMFTSTGLRWQLLLLQLTGCVSAFCFCSVERRVKQTDQEIDRPEENCFKEEKRLEGVKDSP